MDAGSTVRPRARVRFALATMLVAALAACGGGGGAEIPGPGSGGTGLPSGFAPNEDSTTPSPDDQTPTGNQFRSGTFPVNATTAGNQGRAAVAALEGGGFVAAWTSSTATGNSAVVIQRFDAQGNPVGAETQVTARGSSPALAALAGGGFLVTWSASPYMYEAHGYAQRYDGQGSPIGAPIQLAATYFKYSARPMGLPDGGFVLAVDTTTGRYGSDYGQVQRYTADGTHVGQPVSLTSEMSPQTTAYSPNWAGFTTTARWPDGRFAAAWVAAGNAEAGSEVRLTRFDAQGNATGTATVARGSGLQHPTLAVLAGGQLALAWASGANDAPKTVHLELFNAAGTSLGRRVVATGVPGVMVAPRIAALADGGFALAWKGTTYTGTSMTATVQAQRFDAAGQPAGGVQQVSSVESPLPNDGFDHDTLDVMGTQGSNFLVLHGRYSAGAGWDVHAVAR